MRSATFECDPSLAEEEEITIDARDRIRLLIAALATQLVLGKTVGSFYGEVSKRSIETVNLFKNPI
jgi:hypothetical protein